MDEDKKEILKVIKEYWDKYSESMKETKLKEVLEEKGIKEVEKLIGELEEEMEVSRNNGYIL